MKHAPLLIPSIHSRLQCSAVLYGWFIVALRIQVGLCNEGRDLRSGQSRCGTIQQMAVQKNEEENELVHRAASGEEFIPHCLSHRAEFGHDGANEWMDGRDRRRAGRADTGQNHCPVEAGALSRSRERFCLQGFLLPSEQTVQSAGGDKTVTTDVRAVFGSLRRSSVFTVNTSELGWLLQLCPLCSAAHLFSSLVPLSCKKTADGSLPKAAAGSRKCDFGLFRANKVQEMSSLSDLSLK